MHPLVGPLFQVVDDFLCPSSLTLAGLSGSLLTPSTSEKSAQTVTSVSLCTTRMSNNYYTFASTPTAVLITPKTALPFAPAEVTVTACPSRGSTLTQTLTFNADISACWAICRLFASAALSDACFLTRVTSPWHLSCSASSATCDCCRVSSSSSSAARARSFILSRAAVAAEASLWAFASYKTTHPVST